MQHNPGESRFIPVGLRGNLGNTQVLVYFDHITHVTERDGLVTAYFKGAYTLQIQFEGEGARGTATLLLAWLMTRGGSEDDVVEKA